jgi:hypothetical protein
VSYCRYIYTCLHLLAESSSLKGRPILGGNWISRNCFPALICRMLPDFWKQLSTTLENWGKSWLLSRKKVNDWGFIVTDSHLIKNNAHLQYICSECSPKIWRNRRKKGKIILLFIRAFHSRYYNKFLAYKQSLTVFNNNKKLRDTIFGET